MTEPIDPRQFKPAIEDLMLIHPGFAHCLTITPQQHEQEAAKAAASGVSAYYSRFGADCNSGKPFHCHNGIAAIPVMGTLLHRSMTAWSYATGYDAIRHMFMAALADDEVKEIVYDMNSPGGYTNGCFELCEFLLENRGKKRTTAMVDASCYSACYAVACTADRIVLTNSGGVGSIGVVAMHVSIAGALQRFGEEITYLYAGKHKIDGNPYQKLSGQAAAAIQARVDSLDKDFESLVARGRGMSEADVAATEARVFYGQDAVNAGLADSVMSSHEAIAGIINELSGSTQSEEYNMTQVTSQQPAAMGQDPKATSAAPTAASAPAPAPAPAPASADAPAPAPAAEAAPVDQEALAKAERERIQAITGCEEAKANTKLANHLAFNTSASVEEAKEMLKAAGEEAPASDDAPSTDALAQAMAAEGGEGQPQVPAGSGGDVQTRGEEDGASDLLKAYNEATGSKLTKQ